MSNDVVKQAVSEWMSAYAEEHLKGFKGEGEVLEQEQDWGNWLKEQAPEKFEAYLIEEGRISMSIRTLQEWLKPWFEDDFTKYLLVEEWREDYDGRKKA